MFQTIVVDSIDGVELFIFILRISIILLLLINCTKIYYVYIFYEYDCSVWDIEMKLLF